MRVVHTSHKCIYTADFVQIASIINHGDDHDENVLVDDALEHVHGVDGHDDGVHGGVPHDDEHDGRWNEA
ncbi:hypothetical protein CEXT_229921 [Caerostris extrusa]|uniref:Uncharacterized protein n=1 Tax=Caerostris extrusa TaxID=172846 RepID=A0AAV4MQ30_CAEEX|nr:hypothetical protein CEXT_229921 [Caerostris extrusa]